MSDRCVICEKQRTEASELCRHHAEMRDAIKHSYEIWLEAYDGRLSENDFLKRISCLNETGEEAKRVAVYLLLRGVNPSNVNDPFDL